MHLSYVFLFLSGWCLGVWRVCICSVHKCTSMAEFAIFLCFLLYWFLGNGANGVVKLIQALVQSLVYWFGVWGFGGPYYVYCAWYAPPFFYGFPFYSL